MARVRLLIAGLLLLAGAAPGGAAPGSASEVLASSVRARRLSEAWRTFQSLAHPSPADHFLGGHACIELHWPLEAEPPLRAAKAAGFQGWQGWTGVDALLERVRTIRELAPPARPPWASPPDPSITVFAGPPTPWSAPVLAALPEFAAVGRRIFGKDLPPLSAYLFADRVAYDRFFLALFGMPSPASWQDGTGTLNVVTFCERDRLGQATRQAGAPETVSAVLHEFGHAWVGTYLMSRYNREWLSPSMRRPWLDEGLADLVASLREPAHLERRAVWLRDKVRMKAPAPPFEEIATYDAFYGRGDVEVHYWLSALFVAELLGPRDRAPEAIRRLLDAAGRSGDAEQALRTVTGKDLRAEYERLVKRFW